MKEVAIDNSRRQEIFETALGVIAASLPGGKPVLYGPNNRPLSPSASYNYRRNAAKRSGSMKNWIPKRFLNDIEEANERAQIVDRSIDLVNNDPHASGVVDSIATTVIGSGLTPHPILDADILALDKEKIRNIQAQQRAVFQTWQPFADAGQRMSFGMIQHLVKRNMMQYGEYLVLLPMLKDPTRPYSLACQVICPLRLQTPTDKMTDKNIKDGVEIGDYGEPVAYWIRKTERDTNLSESVIMASSQFFMRIPAKQGHRWNVLHGFAVKDSEQYRGMPFLVPAMKYFRDLNDYLDAELVSNIVTAAFALFIEVPENTDPYMIANQMASLSGEQTTTTTDTVRYQEIVPGQVMYGNQGEKPSPISAARPGTTFEPFTKVIKKAMSMALGMPYPVLFKDVENVNYAGFRSAMLDAWRVFMMERTWLGQGFCQPIYTMLQEEAYLRGELKAKKFYTYMHPLTRAEWRGSPKGDIEPIKAAQADIMKVQNNLKTRAACIAEDGGDVRTTFDQLQEEQEMMAERGLTETPITPVTPAATTDGAVDDMPGAGYGFDQS